MDSNNNGRIVVTEQNFGELLIEGLQEALAVARGEQEPSRTRERARMSDNVGSDA
jgi:hypothetical protein